MKTTRNKNYFEIKRKNSKICGSFYRSVKILLTFVFFFVLPFFLGFLFILTIISGRQRNYSQMVFFSSRNIFHRVSEPRQKRKASHGLIETEKNVLNISKYKQKVHAQILPSIRLIRQNLKRSCVYEYVASLLSRLLIVQLKNKFRNNDRIKKNLQKQNNSLFLET